MEVKITKKKKLISPLEFEVFAVGSYLEDRKYQRKVAAKINEVIRQLNKLGPNTP